MDTANPIKQFFSASNVRTLYQTIQQGLKEQYSTTIDDRYMAQLVDVMKIVVEPLPKRIPATVDKNWFVQSLNKQVIQESIPLFIGFVTKKPVGGSSTPLLPPPQQPKMERPDRPQTTNANNNASADDEALTKLVNDRSDRRPPMQRPKFEDDQPEYPDDINDLYEMEEQFRQQSDVMAPPQERFGETLSTPISYTASTPIGDVPPRGAERFHVNATPIAATPIVSTPIVPPLASLTHPVPEPPQPSQLRLIPETSRNQVTDSRAIPHVLIVNSADRNINIYPNPSQYRVQLDDRYYDVEALELCCALIPLSAYNVNTSNNVLLFEETAGVTLTALIPVGNYPDVTALSVAVAASLTAASVNGVTYTATVDPLTNKITITSDGAGGSIFTLIFFGQPTLEGIGPTQFQRERPAFPPNSIGGVLGYNPQDYTGALTYTAPNVPNIDGEPAVYLHVEEAEMLESNNTNVRNALACIALAGGEESRGYERFSSHEWCRFVRYYSPLEGKIANLTITMRTASGALFDFNGRDHVLTFTITTRDKAQPVYGNDRTDRSGEHH
jgi:hypothetical protein